VVLAIGDVRFAYRMRPIGFSFPWAGATRLDRYRALCDGRGDSISRIVRVTVSVRSSAEGLGQVLGRGEGLTDLGGQAPPFGDGQRGGDPAQRDLHGDVVAADNEQHAQGGVVACLIAPDWVQLA
jgi:hypothetical protein